MAVIATCCSRPGWSDVLLRMPHTGVCVFMCGCEFKLAECACRATWPLRPCKPGNGRCKFKVSAEVLEDTEKRQMSADNLW